MHICPPHVIWLGLVTISSLPISQSQPLLIQATTDPLLFTTVHPYLPQEILDTRVTCLLYVSVFHNVTPGNSDPTSLKRGTCINCKKFGIHW